MIPEVIAVFGEYIKECRLAAGLTQKQLGLMCGYEESSADRVVQLWEHDKQPVPLNKLRILARSLDIPLDSLIP